MFQKLATALKAKTYDLFAEQSTEESIPLVDEDEPIDLSFIDSCEDNLSDQRVVVIKPSESDQLDSLHSLLASLFATISSFQVSYLLLQTSHAPFDAHSIMAADRAAVSHLQRLSQLKQAYIDNFNDSDATALDLNLTLDSHVKSQVEENQSLLRILGQTVDRLQSEIDQKDGEVFLLRKKLEKVEASHARLEKHLDNFCSSSPQLLLNVSLFDSVLRDARRAARCFTRALIDQMSKVGVDVDSVVNSIYPEIMYPINDHKWYAILSFVCCNFFDGFSSENFSFLRDSEEVSTPGSSGTLRRKSLLQFVTHGSADAMELLDKNPYCDFAKFCYLKYEQLFQSSIMCSLVDYLGRKEALFSSSKLSSQFYEAFCNVASLVWMLHKLAFAFDPKVEVFPVERGASFSVVHMKNVVPTITPRKLSIKRCLEM